MHFRSKAWWARVAGVGLAVGIFSWLAVRSLNAQAPAQPAEEDTGVFTTAHRTVGDALREFFGIRSTPVQPIQFTHQVHVGSPNLFPCVTCHSGVDQGPDATMPSVSLCMSCHVAIATDKPEIQKMAAYQAKGQDIPWQRVYGFQPTAHVKFNHAPHIRAGVDCATCHGDMTKQTVAQRAVNHTMGFCITCHVQHQASVDCVTCHF